MTPPDSCTLPSGLVVRHGEPVDPDLARRLIALGFVPHMPLYPVSIGFHPTRIGSAFAKEWSSRCQGDLRLRIMAAPEPASPFLAVVIRRVEIVYAENPDYEEDRSALRRYVDPPDFCIHGTLSEWLRRWRFLGEHMVDNPEDPRNWEVTPIPPLPVRAYITLHGDREAPKEGGWGYEPRRFVGDSYAQVIREPYEPYPDAQLTWSTEVPPEVIN